MGKVVPYVAAATVSLAVVLLLASASPVDEARLWRHRNLGKAFFETPTTVPQAVEELKKALDLAPDSFRDRLNHGLALLRSGDGKAAIAELEKAQKQEPKIPHTWFNLGVAYKREGRHPDAIRQFERMAQLAPDEPVTHYNLGLLYNLTDRAADALKQFETAAALDSKLVAPRFQIYNIYRLQGNDAGGCQGAGRLPGRQAAQQAADDSEDMEWCYYAEFYDPLQARPAGRTAGAAAELRFRDEKLAGAVDPKTSGLLVIDAFGEGKADLLAWSRDGIRLYRNGRQAIEQTGLERLKGVIAVSAGDFDNDGLPDLCMLTETGPLLYRNTKGRFEARDASLPAGRFEAAVWLDFDHDYDLDLFLFGAPVRAAAQRERRPPRLHRALPVCPRPRDRRRSRFASCRIPRRWISRWLMRIARACFTAISCAACFRPRRSMPCRPAPPGCARWTSTTTAGSTSGSPRPRACRWRSTAAANSSRGALAARAAAIAFADLENRGLSDLVASNAVYRNLGLAQLAPAKTPAGFPAAVAWAEADFDGDGRADLAAVAPDGSLHLLGNQTATKNRSLSVALTGVKNLKAGAGAEVEVKAGDHYQKKTYEGVPLLFGLGPRHGSGHRTNQLAERSDSEPAEREGARSPIQGGPAPVRFLPHGVRLERPRVPVHHRRARHGAAGRQFRRWQLLPRG